LSLMSVEDNVREASRLLRDAYEQSECKWCARHLLRLSEITQDLSVVLPYTAETAQRISGSTAEDIEREGGKIAVLKNVVIEGERRKTTPIESKNINIEHEYKQNRGIPMDKKTAMYTVGSQLAFGTGLGFALNRVNEKYTQTYGGQTVGTLVNVIGGLGLVVMGAMGIGLKNSTYQMMEVVGGGAMLQNGALAMLEKMYAGAHVASAKPAAKAYLPVNARGPGQIAPRIVDISSY